MKSYKSTLNPEMAAEAVHHQEGTDHIVGIANLRVVLCQEDGFWFAQGVEIDYSAEGTSLEKVKESFQSGLCATINLHLQKFGSLDHLLKWAPQSEWKGLQGERMRYSQVSHHIEVKEDVCFPDSFPYAGINYLELQAA